MKRGCKEVIGSAIIAGAFLTVGVTGNAFAGVDVGVNINIGPPPIVVPAPPEVVLVPRTQVYFVPGVEFDVFFHNGWWWSPRGDRWFRSRAYNGPWNIVERRYVPRAVIRVPRDYRSVYARERRIPYGQWKKERRHFKEERRHEQRKEYRERSEEREYGERGEHGHGRGR